MPDSDTDGPLATALALKEQGNAAFKSKQHGPAAELYSGAIDALLPHLEKKQVDDFDGSEDAAAAPAAEEPGAAARRSEMAQLLGTCYANRAACRIGEQRFLEAVDDCTDCLKWRPTFSKAVFRRAAAHEGLARLMEEEEDAVAAGAGRAPASTPVEAAARAEARKHLSSAVVDAEGRVRDVVLHRLEQALVDLRLCAQMDAGGAAPSAAAAAAGGKAKGKGGGAAAAGGNKAATQAAQRVRDAMQRLRLKRQSFQTHWRKLSAGGGAANAGGVTARQRRQLIGVLMSMFMGSRATAAELRSLKFPQLLMRLVLPGYEDADAGADSKPAAAETDPEVTALQTVAARALRTVVAVTKTDDLVADVRKFVRAVRMYVKRVSRPFVLQIAHQMDVLADKARRRMEAAAEQRRSAELAADGGSTIKIEEVVDGEEDPDDGPEPSPADRRVFDRTLDQKLTTMKMNIDKDKAKESKAAGDKSKAGSAGGTEGDSVVLKNTAESKFINTLIGLMARIAADARYDCEVEDWEQLGPSVSPESKEADAAAERQGLPSRLNLRRILLEDLLILLQVPCVVDHGDGADDDEAAVKRGRRHRITAFELARVRAVLQGLGIIAGGDGQALKMVRAFSLPHVMFSRLVSIPAVKQELISCLVMVTKAYGTQQSKVRKDKFGNVVSGGDQEPRQKKGKDGSIIPPTPAEEEAAAAKQRELVFREQIARFLVTPLLVEDGPTHRKAARALSLLLQSNPELGIHVVTHKPPGKCPGPVFAKAGETLSDAQIKRNEVLKKEKEEEDALPPAALHTLVLRTIEGEAVDRRLASECLALASSDQVVRAMIGASGNSDVFFELMAHANPIVRVHAGLALARMAAVGTLDDDVRDRIFGDRAVIETIVDVVQLAAAQAEQRQKLQEARDLRAARRKARLAAAAAAAGGATGAAVDADAGSDEEDGEEDAVDEEALKAGPDTVIITADCLRDAVEALSYLSLNLDSKRVIANQNDGEWLRGIFKLFGSSDKALRYGAVSTLYNLCTSHEDIMADYDHEIEELKKVARRGLPGAEDDKKEEVLLKKAGEAKDIAPLKQQCVRQGGVTALLHAYKAYMAEAERKLEEADGRAAAFVEAEKGTGGEDNDAEKKKKEPTKIPFNRQQPKRSQRGEDAPRRLGANVDNEEAMAKINEIGKETAESMTRTLLRMACDPDNRGRMVQQGAVRLLTNLCRHSEEKAHKSAALALARIAISVNPALFDSGELLSLIVPLMGLIEAADSELEEFEATMALTNLASSDDDARRKLMAEGAWGLMQQLLGSDNEQVQRAAVECLTNLITTEQAVKRLRSYAGHQDIKILVLFCGSEDVAAAQAASGALAMVSGDKEIAKKIGVQKGIEHFVCAIATPDLELGIRHRLNVVIQNMARHWLPDDQRTSDGADPNPASAPAGHGLNIARDLVAMKPVFDALIEEYDAEEARRKAKDDAEMERGRREWEEKEKARKAKFKAEYPEEAAQLEREEKERLEKRAQEELEKAKQHVVAAAAAAGK